MTKNSLLLHNLSSFCHFSKNLNIKVYKTVILLAVLYGYKTCTLIPWEEQNLGCRGEYMNLRERDRAINVTMEETE
jgi:hypothetical protein